jgi:hypothetical protein
VVVLRLLVRGKGDDLVDEGDRMDEDVDVE